MNYVFTFLADMLFFTLAGPNMLVLLTNEGKSGSEEAEKGDSHSVSLKGAMSLILKGLSECLSSTGTGNLVITGLCD